MDFVKGITLVSTLLASMSVFSNTDAGADAIEDRIGMKATRSIMVTANVKAIDHESRLVTLTDQEGGEYTFIARDNARNLDQVNVGDLVSAEYVHTIEMKVLHADEAPVVNGEMDIAGRSAVGEKPAGKAVTTSVKVLTITEIDLEGNAFKLQDADGVVNQFNASNPQNLQRAVVGDVVVITNTQALALSIDAVPTGNQ